MNRLVYTLLMYLLIPFFVLRLLWRSRKNPVYKERIGERFGLMESWPEVTTDQHIILIHAVSVGEVHAAVPLIRKILSVWPQFTLLVTTTTPTGSERVRDIFGDSVLHVYLPWDIPDRMEVFVNYFNPRMVILLETELWPNLIHKAHENKSRVALVNARLSQKSADRYGKYGKHVVREMLGNLDLVCTQANADAYRFKRLGLDPDKAVQVPSLKYDIVVPEDQASKGKALRETLFGQRPVVIAASTRQGEEEQVIDAFLALRKNIPDAALVLVPRHPDRSREVFALASNSGLDVRRRSLIQPDSEHTDILIGDTLGEMFLYYSLADVAYVGGSLVNTGCQNILEPAAMGMPVVTGPSLYNFKHVSDALVSDGGQRIVRNSAELFEAWQELLNDADLRSRMGAGARQGFERYGGGSERVLMELQKLFRKTPDEQTAD